MFPVKDYDAAVVQLRTGDYLAGRRDAIKKMLEIIDKTDAKSDNTSAFDFGITYACSEIREEVLAFKGE